LCVSEHGSSKPNAREDRPRGLEASTEADDSTDATLARGRRGETPFLLVGGTALVVWSVAALFAGVVLLVWWLG
jgi:hypothetical protein